MFTLDFIEYCAILNGVVNKDCVFFEKIYSVRLIVGVKNHDYLHNFQFFPQP